MPTDLHLLIPTDRGWRVHCGGNPGREGQLIPLEYFAQYQAQLCAGCRQWPQPATTSPQPTPGPQPTRQDSEKAFMARVIAEAKRTGWLVFHAFDARKSSPGYPDLCLAKTGRPVLLIECKTDRGRLTPTQREWLTTLQTSDRTVIAEVWRPSDWDTILQTLHP